MSSEPDDLLGKADALMARHHPARAAAAPYAQIPVLDEVVDYLPDDDDLPLLTEAVVPVPMGQDRTEALVAGIRASVLAGLQPGVDALIVERLRDNLAPLVETMLGELRGNLQMIAREILSEAIDTAVEQALERSKSDQ